MDQKQSQTVQRALAVTICEGIWIRQVMIDFQLEFEKSVTFKCNNQATVRITKDLVHHNRTKHVEDPHFIAERI